MLDTTWFRKPATGVDMKKDKIAILSINGIGDTIMLTPMIRLLRCRCPRANIIVVVSTVGARQVLGASPYIDELISLGRTFSKYARNAKHLWSLRRRKLDVSITGFSSTSIENVFAGVICAKRRIVHVDPCRAKPPPSYRLQNVHVPMNLQQHTVLQNINLLAPLGIFPDKGESLDVEVRLTERDIAAGQRILEKHRICDEDLLIGMHPGSSQEKGMLHKRWPATSFAALGNRVLREYPFAKILLFGGPDEQTLRVGIADAMCHAPIIVSDRSLRTTAALIERCNVFVSNDSGLMHLATAMKTPTVGIFGPTDSTITAPRGSEDATIVQDLECRPCHPVLKLRTMKNFKLRCCYHEPFACLTQLDVSKVFERIKAILAKRHLTHLRSLERTKPTADRVSGADC